MKRRGFSWSCLSFLRNWTQNSSPSSSWSSRPSPPKRSRKGPISTTTPFASLLNPFTHTSNSSRNCAGYASSDKSLVSPTGLSCGLILLGLVWSLVVHDADPWVVDPLLHPNYKPEPEFGIRFMDCNKAHYSKKRWACKPS